MAGTPPYCASFSPRRQADRAVSIGAAIIAAVLASAAATANDFDAGRAPFAVTINDTLVVPYRVFAIYVLPGENIEIAPMDGNIHQVYTLATADGLLANDDVHRWQWTAPTAPGVTQLVLRGEGADIRLNAVVLHPAARMRNGRLNGYRIDDYPPPLDGSPVYAPPLGFIEVSADTLDLELSPNFRLSQFPSKQPGGYPKYVALREQLLIKLELLLEEVNNRGVPADTFSVMSGFRTPFYNRAIRNVAHSRHVYGGAADIFIDVAPRDDVMDDLNGDGRVDIRDAQWLYRVADELFARYANEAFRGGLGVYRSTAAHGPFLHIDARGRSARWGQLP